MSVGLMSIVYGLIAGYIGYLLGIESRERKARTKRPSMYQWTWLADQYKEGGRHDNRGD